MRQLTILLLLTILIVGCVNKEDKKYKECEYFTWEDIGDEVLLHGDDLALGEKLTRPMRLSLSDSILFLLNNDTEGIVQLINIKTNKEIGRYGTFGSGPQDLMTPRYIQKKDSSLFIYDSNLRRFNRYIIADGTLKLMHSTQFSCYFDDVLMLPNSTLVANVLDPRLKKLSFFRGDSMLNTVGDYPLMEGNGKEIDSDGIVKLEGFSSSLAYNNRKIAVFYKQTDLLEIYNDSGHLNSRIQGPDLFFPAKSMKTVGDTQKVVANINEERDAYFSPVATNNELFVLYSGKIYNPGDKGLLDQIFVFDWNGKPLRRYKLDIPIFRFTIDESSHIIYGLTDSPEFRIIRFKL